MSHNPILVGPLNYAYDESPDLRAPSGRGIFGWCDTTRQAILAEQNMYPARKLACRWHETLHAVANDYGIRLSEQTVATLAMVITQILRDNPEMRGADESVFSIIPIIEEVQKNQGKEVKQNGTDPGADDSS